MLFPNLLFSGVKCLMLISFSVSVNSSQTSVMHNSSSRDDVVFILSITLHQGRNRRSSGKQSGRASNLATETRGDLSHSLAFNSFEIYIAHEKSFGSFVAIAPEQYLKGHGSFLLGRGLRYGEEADGVKSSR